MSQRPRVSSRLAFAAAAFALPLASATAAAAQPVVVVTPATTPPTSTPVVPAPRVIAEMEGRPRPRTVHVVTSVRPTTVVHVHSTTTTTTTAPSSGTVTQAPFVDCGIDSNGLRSEECRLPDPPRLMLQLGAHSLALLDRRDFQLPEARIAVAAGVAVGQFDVGYAFDAWTTSHETAGDRFRSTALLQTFYRFEPNPVVRPRIGIGIGARIERDDLGLRAAGVIRGTAGVEFAFARDAARIQPSVYIDTGVEYAPFGHERLRGVDMFVGTGLRLALDVGALSSN